jgi:hypothetical protein
MKPLRILVAAAAVTVVSIAVWAILRSRVPDIDPLTADELSATADQLCEQLPNRIVPPDQWPIAVRKLYPHSVLVSPDGVYIERGSWFVESWGVFVLRSRSAFRPTSDTDPCYHLLRGRVYWYEVKG